IIQSQCCPGHFYWQIGGFQVHGQVLITSWVVIAILLGSATIAVRNPQTIPTEGQNFFEYVLEFIRDVSKTQIGKLRLQYILSIVWIS
ncbi:hypothetical protein MIMGU_mgv1a020392mg, partial [Erythranthe guttata]